MYVISKSCSIISWLITLSGHYDLTANGVGQGWLHAFDWQVQCFLSTFVEVPWEMPKKLQSFIQKDSRHTETKRKPSSTSLVHMGRTQKYDVTSVTTPTRVKMYIHSKQLDKTAGLSKTICHSDTSTTKIEHNKTRFRSSLANVTLLRRLS